MNSSVKLAAPPAIAMQCPRCGSTHIRKNGKKASKQNYICVQCRRQFIKQNSGVSRQNSELNSV